MPGQTNRWGLSILGPGDALSADGYKFSDADRRLIDRLLYYATELHRHTGGSGADNTPMSPPTLALLPADGAMPSSARYYYRYTVIDDMGNESAPSPVAVIDTPGAISTPGAPALNYVTGTGSLLPGTYSYVLSAYKGPNTLETKALNSAAQTIPGTNVNNEISLTLPTLPLGADGLNVYRKSTSGTHYLYIASIPSPASGDIWVDDGSVEGDCDRSLPAANRTQNTGAVRITYPGATPDIPAGWSWRIYRSNNTLDWSRSYLADISPQGATPVTPVDFVDVGGGAQLGSPPTVAQVINAPSKINLTDAAEVEGVLPPGLVVVPQIVTFAAPGSVTEGPGSFVWTCDYERADILSVRAYLGVDSLADAQDVIVDVNLLRPNVEGTWISAFDDGPDRPTVPVGRNFGTPVTPIHQHLTLGDSLSVDIDQAGGGAGTDENLTVNILLYVTHGSATDSYNWNHL